MMDQVIAWGVLLAVLVVPPAIMKAWRSRNPYHRWGAKGDGGDVHVERARATGHTMYDGTGGLG